MSRLSLVLLFSICATSQTIATAAPDRARDLTFRERVEAQRGIERVYYRHLEGASRPFEEAVTEAVLENKVRTYLRQSAALEKRWRAPVTGEALATELNRISRSTRMPDRLLELYAALDNDPWLIQECLVRPVLVSRLVHAYAASDTGTAGDDSGRAEESGASWARDAEDLDPSSVQAVADREVPLPMPASTETADAPCAADDAWINGVLDDAPDPLQSASAIWTGSLMIAWGSSAITLQPAGTRYDPVTDTFSPVSTVYAPGNGTAVWTGSEMIVWGGGTGGRYDPNTDQWSSLPTAGAPPALWTQVVVWTGSVMFVWGWDGSTGRGGRYDPAGNQWSQVTSFQAPAGYQSTAVWTGDRVIVWGGYLTTNPGLPYGSSYYPDFDFWEPISVTNEPAHRAFHTAVWSGTEMLVWGGLGENGPPFPPFVNSGARYNPVTDTWTAMSLASAPAAREDHTAVWTGSRMIVWGGYDGGDFKTGGSYNPALNQWVAIPDATAPAARNSHLAVWTGSRMLVWGGKTVFDGRLNTGGQFDPVTAAWTSTNDGGMPSGKDNRTAVWTGNEMILWGLSNTGGRYDPVLDAWAPVSTVNAPVGFAGHTAVWTGEVMAVWGGHTCPPPPGTGCDTPLDTGGRYDPLTDHWDGIATNGAPGARSSHTAIWTGSEMIVWGGTGPTPSNTGGRYDPVQDLWAPMSPGGGLGFSNHRAVWTGQLMLVWQQDRGYRYNPTLDAWSTMGGLPVGLTYPNVNWTAVWTGQQMIIWGGTGGQTGAALNSGARYNPVSNSWSNMTTLNAPTARHSHTAVWNGSVMIVWGGSTATLNAPGGGRYDPIRDEWKPVSGAAAPGPRSGHKAVWDGEGMIVAGGTCCTGGGGFRFYWNKGGRYVLGQDADHDGFGACAGDCDDASAAVHPGAVEACNGFDDDCSGVSDDNPLDLDGDGVAVCFDCRDDLPGVWAIPDEVTGIQAIGQMPTSFSWDSLGAQAGSATQYEFVSGGFSIAAGMDLSSAVCLSVTGTADFTDARPGPGIGAGYWYLGRGVNACGVGTLGSAARDAISVGPCP